MTNTKGSGSGSRKRSAKPSRRPASTLVALTIPGFPMLIVTSEASLYKTKTGLGRSKKGTTLIGWQRLDGNNEKGLGPR